ncbi:hypothetical protein BH20VER3_BH20VER3_02560 [soil metagenome]
MPDQTKKPSQTRIVVVIDVALLGEAHRQKSHARGVHRVAERIVSGLARSPQCELRFVATSHLASSARALEEIGLSQPGRLSYHKSQMWLSRWAERASAWVERTLPDRRVHLRALRWLLQRVAFWADAQSRRIPQSSLLDADIYHSPLKPIPEIAQRAHGVRKFLTVVDVIPLTNPGTVGGKGVPMLRKQLNSLAAHEFAFCISETVKNDLLQIKDISPEHVFVTPLAASEETFHPVSDPEAIRATLRRYDIPDEPYFLALSSFDPRKNFDGVIDYFSALLAEGTPRPVNLVIVGSNPERNRMVETACANFPEARQRIVTPGFIPDADLAAIYSGALSFLFPSLSEGFGMPVLEAMQCGTPVLSSDAPALPEVVGGAGVLVPPQDREAWVKAMAEVVSDPSLRERLRLAGLRRAEGFNWRRFNEALIEGYLASLRRDHSAARTSAHTAGPRGSSGIA